LPSKIRTELAISASRNLNKQVFCAKLNASLLALRCAFQVSQLKHREHRVGLQLLELRHIELGMSESRPLSISVVHPDQFSAGTSQTPGSLRLAAVSADLGIHSALWGGTFLVEPGAQTGIHHHGRQETVAYVLEGESYIQWGERGEHSVTVRAGDFLHVPAWLVHREINRSKEFPFRWVVIRSTSEPIVVNLAEDAWI
jgi:uncharacterized RmlC-like cupin family protein